MIPFISFISPGKMPVLYVPFLTGVLLCKFIHSSAQNGHTSNWSTVNRTWVGPEYWANRLQDWRLKDRKVYCVNEDLPMRTLHILTHRLAERAGTVTMETAVQIGMSKKDSFSIGFLLGAGADLDYRAAALIHLGQGSNGGYFLGLNQNKELFISSHQNVIPELLIISEVRDAAFLEKSFRLKVLFQTDGITTLILIDSAGSELSRVSASLPPDLTGNIALVAHQISAVFDFWNIEGSKLDVFNDRLAGPVLSSQYTLSDNQLHLSAQFMPLGEKDNRIVLLQYKDQDQQWIDIAASDVHSPSYVAAFHLQNWDAAKKHSYRLAYRLVQPDGTEREYNWYGSIVADPVKKPVITVAGFTGNHNCQHGFGSRGYGYDKAHLWFPHNEIVDHVTVHQPDLLFFSGDQVYEGSSPTAPDHENIQLDYLYKWYLWCWAFRTLTKDIPTISIPDDHDVFQGNVWGEGGRRTDKDDKGGYVHPAEFVRMVEQTQASNLPFPVDPRPIKQGIGVYFTNLKYGGIGFAVIEDRKFKSGCNGRLEGASSTRADHIDNPDFDVRSADLPGLKLLGERQLEFIRDWSADWRKEEMKIVLSQTVFANMATHHGGELTRLIGDLDSNGWPQSGRNRALSEIRKGFAFMLAGDQHLASLVHHGVHSHKDAGWSFAVPSIANFYPRAWMPEAEGGNRTVNDPPYLGDHRDGLLNYVSVYAVTNPPALTGNSTGMEPLALYDRTPGYGIVKLNKETREYIVECWPRYANPADPESKQYEGWPRTISQFDNYGKAAVAYLPKLRITGIDDPVIQVFDQNGQTLIYSLRIKGDAFRPKVFKKGKYTLLVGDPDTERWIKHVDVAAEDPGVETELVIRY